MGNKILIIFALCLAIGIVCAQNEPYVLGADISWMQQRENERVKYYRNGQEGDLLSILKEVGFNYIRLRIFVDPKAKDPNVPNDASGWNPYPYSAAGYCGLDSTIKVAKRVKAAGMKFLLDFHYSDTWADPGKQYKPVSWQSLNTVALLSDKVRSYTKESLQKFQEAGALPDMVQVGNEVVHGMIHPEGKNNGDAFAKLVLAGIKGVKDVDPNIKIMIHTINSENPVGYLSTLKSNLNKVEANAANQIDVIGLSYYPKWHGNVDSLKRVMNNIAKNNNIKIAVAEYADFHREVNDAVFNLPDNKGLGTFAWEPQEFSGDDSKPLFDWTNNARRSNARLELYPKMVIDYGLSNVQSSSSSNTPSSSSKAQSSSSSSIQSSSSSADEPSSSSAEDITPILTHAVEKNMENIRVYFDGSRVLIKKTLSNGKVRIFDLKGDER
ncbi:MAG: arabinogalactan endo-1,4-beta-galactosidase [Fibromonadaceae bacterium]|jgi:arabinogalactan endo-1,4-beta-galactosidase|nr:arabinogalactan endo-1,4-beta-galactosidase [Fibromonadaceae bacterium]